MQGAISVFFHAHLISRELVYIRLNKINLPNFLHLFDTYKLNSVQSMKVGTSYDKNMEYDKLIRKKLYMNW